MTLPVYVEFFEQSVQTKGKKSRKDIVHRAAKFKTPKQIPILDKKIKESNFYPASFGTFLTVSKLNHLYLLIYSFCKFCTFEV